MPGECTGGCVAQWLIDAESDLALASIRKTAKIRYSHLCFHAQQASEKAIKAVLLSRKLSVPRTHDIAFLIDMLPTSVELPPALLVLPILTKYAVQNRYPGQEIPVGRSDREKALALAKETLGWAKSVVRTRS